MGSLVAYPLMGLPPPSLLSPDTAFMVFIVCSAAGSTPAVAAQHRRLHDNSLCSDDVVGAACLMTCLPVPVSKLHSRTLAKRAYTAVPAFARCAGQALVLLALSLAAAAAAAAACILVMHALMSLMVLDRLWSPGCAPGAARDGGDQPHTAGGCRL